jgi:hypothetical protein
MRILLDQNVPAPLRHALAGHQVETAYERGWAELMNGELIMKAESDGFDLLITSDQRIPYQHNWTGRSLALPVLSTNDWNSIRRSQDRILAAVNAIRQSECVSFDVPRGE